MHGKKTVFFIASLLFFQSVFSYPIKGAERQITLDTAREKAIENSEGVQGVIIDRIKKEIELKQAQDAIQDIRKKESTIRFSLLINIKFPEKHGMPKEIELLTKVPQIQNEIVILNRQEIDEKLKSQTEGEQAFYDVILAEQERKYLEKRVKDSANVLEKVKLQFQMGTGKRTDLEYMETQLSDYQKELDRAILTLDEKKRQLGSVTGTDVRLGYTFETEFSQTSLTRNLLPDLIEYAKEHDFTLFQAVQKRKLAEKEVETVLGIYKSRYGSYIQEIESYLKNQEGKKINYDDFIQKYNKTLTDIDSPWYGDYVIRILFFKIRIPKEWFKGEYSGTRYMEDEKYALFISLTERDKARKEEENARKALEEKINRSYTSLKAMELSLKQQKENLTKAQDFYEIQLRENKMGLVDFTTLESARNALYAKERMLFETEADYAKSLSAFNQETAGYINRLLERTEKTDSEYEAGDSSIENAVWWIQNEITNYNFIFGVEIPEEYEVDSYQLFYGNLPVGEPLKLEETLIHPALTYGDTESLTLHLYQEGHLKYTASFEGNSFGGTLELKREDGEWRKTDATEQRAEGNWSLTEIDPLRDEFYFTLNDDIEYDSFQILYEEKEILASEKKGGRIKMLKLYFNPADALSVVFLKNGEKVKTLYLEENADGQKILVLERKRKQ